MAIIGNIPYFQTNPNTNPQHSLPNAKVWSAAWGQVNWSNRDKMQRASISTNASAESPTIKCGYVWLNWRCRWSNWQNDMIPFHVIVLTCWGLIPTVEERKMCAHFFMETLQKECTWIWTASIFVYVYVTWESQEPCIKSMFKSFLRELKP